MDAVIQELATRKAEIEKELELLFTTNLKITDWDVPEADDQKSATILWRILDKKMQSIKKDIDVGKYTDY